MDDDTIIQQYRQRLVQFGRSPSDNTPFLENAIVHWVSIVVGVITCVVCVLLFFNITPEQIAVKLQYNVYFGASVQAQWWSPYVIVGVGIFFYALDLVLACILYNVKARIAAYALLLGGLFAHIALLVATISIVLNN